MKIEDKISKYLNERIGESIDFNDEEKEIIGDFRLHGEEPSYEGLSFIWDIEDLGFDVDEKTIVRISKETARSSKYEYAYSVNITKLDDTGEEYPIDDISKPFNGAMDTSILKKLLEYIKNEAE